MTANVHITKRKYDRHEGVDIYCKDGWVVYDPFMGSGTTAISCVRRGLGYVGSELSENQIKFAQDRLDKEKEKIFISNNIESLF